MSTVTTLTIEGPVAPFPSTAWVAENALERHISLPGMYEGSITERSDAAANTASLMVQWDDERWSIDGIQEFAAFIAETWPVFVQLTEEWDTRDADEAGEQGWRWRYGVLQETGQTEMVWSPVA